MSQRFVNRLPVLLLVLLAACQTGGNAKFVDTTVEAPSERVLWQVTVLSLEKTGFPVGSGLEPGKLRGVSGWQTSLAPFKGEGFRERCHIDYSSLGAGRYGLKVRVERETNEDIMHPLDISYAEWKGDADNTARAQMVAGYVKQLLGGEFRMADKEKPVVAPKRPTTADEH